jgi:protein arginine N-methyltransferase 1
VYDLADFGRMLADTVRTEAYARALEHAVHPDSVVLDIGTGTGIMALFAARFGARRVYAVEPLDVIQVAKELAMVNGYADRIEFIQDLSTRIVLPERADVVVAEIHGALPLYSQHLPSVADARERHLKKGGTQIPRKETLWLGLIEAPDSYRREIDVWSEHSYGFDITPLKVLAPNNWWRERVPTDRFLTSSACWATLDYATLTDPNATGEVELGIERSGTAHGLCLWFDSELAEGIGFSNGPQALETIFGRAVLALTSPVSVQEGDLARVQLDARLLDDRYVWRWRTSIFREGESKPAEVLDQSTLAGVPLTLESLHKSQASYVPSLGAEGEIDRLALEFMSKGLSLGEISSQLEAEFPARFPNSGDALRRVARLSQKYSQ